MRTVINNVFDGGEGAINGGRDERSRESGVPVPSSPSNWRIPLLWGDEVGEAGGDMSMDEIMVQNTTDTQSVVL